LTILVDSNIPMYLIGAEHPNKHAIVQRLDELIASRDRLVTDVEVLQEILHRYTAIKRPEAVQPAFDALLDVVDDVLSVAVAEVEEAKRIVLGRYGVSARDALHLAVMRANGIRRILSFDADFDRYPGVERVS
jgi:predicted nucleic acid-binding protein